VCAFFVLIPPSFAVVAVLAEVMHRLMREREGGKALG